MARVSLKKMKEQTKTQSGYNNDIWTPMGQLDMDKKATLRLVPWIDPVSQGLWTIKKTMTATFVNPNNDNEEWYAKIPCLEQYEDAGKCPVADKVRALYKEAEELKEAGATKEEKRVRDIAKAHWIKYNFFYQGFVLKGGKEEVDPNTLVPMMFPMGMHKIVQAAIQDDDTPFEALPSGEFTLEDIALLGDGETDGTMTEDEFMELFVGRPLIASKTKQGEFNNYDQSSWDLKDHALADEQIAYIAENGLIDLRKFIPAQPSEEQYEVYQEMMDISIQAALGNEDNTWRPEWEKLDIKPIKPKSSSSGGDNASSGGSVKDRLKAKRAASSDDDGGTKSGSVRDKLKGARGKASADDAAPADDAVDESTATDETGGGDDADEAPAEGKKLSLKERLAKAKAKTSEEA